MTTNTQAINHNGHRKRLRDRLACEPQAVEDYEVLELLLGLSLPRRDTRPLAQTLLDRFGNIRGVLDARTDELEQVEGFGPGLLALWRLQHELMVRYSLAPLLNRERLCSSEAVAAVGKARLGHLSHEESWLALVDAKNHLISWERLRKGSVSSIALHPRDILEQSLARKASGFILVHNHPGGDPHPSQPDIDITSTLQKLAPLLDLRFLDHVIVTRGECYSIVLDKLIRPPEVK